MFSMLLLENLFVIKYYITNINSIIHERIKCACVHNRLIISLLPMGSISKTKHVRMS